MIAAWLFLGCALLLTGARPSSEAAQRPRPTMGPGLPLALDLTAVALRAGQPLDRALSAAATAAGRLAERLTAVARLLALGAEPADAWAAVADDPALAGVATVARRSAQSGIRVAAAFENLATALRAQAADAGRARAHRAGVLAAAPLGLCFLPAFVCLAVVPALLGLAATVLK